MGLPQGSKEELATAGVRTGERKTLQVDLEKNTTSLFTFFPLVGTLMLRRLAYPSSLSFSSSAQSKPKTRDGNSKQVPPAFCGPGWHMGATMLCKHHHIPLSALLGMSPNTLCISTMESHPRSIFLFQLQLVACQICSSGGILGAKKTPTLIYQKNIIF